MLAHPLQRDAGAMDSPAKPVGYEIRVRGILSETLLAGFPDLVAEADGSDTVLVGALLDQAALYGVLNQLEALGLGLLEVLSDPVPPKRSSRLARRS